MAEFLQRLKKRKLVQWALAYLAGAWVLLQVLDLVGQKFGWPDAVGRVLIIASCVGFFVTLLLAWYHGERGEQKVSGVELLLLALVLAVGGAALWRFAPSVSVPEIAAKPMPPPPAQITAMVDIPAKSIAVLPFVSLSPGQDNAYFADGLSEEVINSLSRVPDLQVAARTSSFAFRDTGKTIPQIAGALRVATVLEGSVRRAGGKLRMTAHLIRAADGYELWSETYDRNSEDIIAIQEDVARSIAQALKTAVDPAALLAMQRAGTRLVPAYQAYLQGLALVQQAEQQGNYALQTDALVALNQAIDLDPGFVDAYARAADLEMSLLRPATMGGKEAWTSDYAQRLQRLRHDLARAAANARNGAERAYFDALRAASELRFDDALGLMRQYTRAYPHVAQAHDFIAGWLLIMGDDAAASTEAIAAAEAAGTLQSGTVLNNGLLYVLVMAGDGKRAAHYARLALVEDPDGVETAYQAQRALLTAGATADAAKLVPGLLASNLDALTKVVVQVRQACAEGRVAEAQRLYTTMATIDDPSTAQRWHVLHLLGRPAEASRLFAYMDTPVYLSALSSYLMYPYFDVRRFPNLQKVLLGQGIQRPPPRREPYACPMEPGDG